MARMDENLTADLVDPFADWGQPAIYMLASTGVESSIQVIFTEKAALEGAQWSAALQTTAEILVIELEVADPQRNDTVTIGGIVWTVASRTSLSGGLFLLNVFRDLRPTFRK